LDVLALYVWKEGMIVYMCQRSSGDPSALHSQGSTPDTSNSIKARGYQATAKGKLKRIVYLKLTTISIPFECGYEIQTVGK
jgi:hypothetical protein